MNWRKELEATIRNAEDWAEFKRDAELGAKMRRRSEVTDDALIAALRRVDEDLRRDGKQLDQQARCLYVGQEVGLGSSRVRDRFLAMPCDSEGGRMYRRQK